MATLKIYDAASRRGQKKIDKTLRRGDAVLDAEILAAAEKIVRRIRGKGDKALLKAVRRYDGSKAGAIADLRLVPKVDRTELPTGFREALERSIGAVERYHAGQVHPGFTMSDGGLELEERREPLRRVGIYIPGGRAVYPSSVVMTVVPARLAGVEEIVVATPPGGWDDSPALRYALERLEVKEIWGMGGAHAVAALAHGTETIERVDKIVGPGNAWVTAGKKLVQGEVAIDGLAGPSEVVVVADGSADPELVAGDLLAQAEHDPLAMALLVTTEKKFAKAVAKAVDRQLADLATAAVAKASISGTGAALLVEDLDAAVKLTNDIAPEHLQLLGEAIEARVGDFKNAGAIFVGRFTGEVFGDYIAGPSHVLPTVGTARFTSALGVEDFIRRSHVVRFDAAAAAHWAAAAATLADVEGLPAHAASARRRVGA